MHGRRGSAGKHERPRPFLTSPPNLRLIMILTLAVGSILGSVYVLGRTLSTPEAKQDRLGASASANPSGVTTGSPSPNRRSETSQLPSPSVTPADPDREAALADDRPRLPMEKSGPFGGRISTGSREVALTFDDGPDPRYTPEVLALLQRYRVKATFCVVGEQAQAYPELIRAIAAAGHTLCNHSWNHDVTLGSRSKATIRSDLTRTNAAIRAAVPGARIVYYRQPGGAWTSAVVATAWELGMTSLHWDVDPQDWARPGAGSIASTVTADVGAGSIVLMHDAGGNRQQTVTALKTILPNLLRRFELESLPTGLPRAAADGTGGAQSRAPEPGASAATPEPAAHTAEPSTADTDVPYFPAD
jgi:peptidoglycan/xylan/chitin deacetylase (PgdA/CDA1 family)